ncbi:lactase-phlorizin hydrolase-like [Thrips palmi]|uniref:Lactase-phlorizin hydrolase-like n=1 Tax=Thrips palmi TaxID=161013 RepID=A0A6P8ZXP5_THRPL|nr:lactase-phlorizin hydrolase-like [Thrips palmi]
MKLTVLLWVFAVCGLSRASSLARASGDDAKYTLPEGFLLGVATSAYQIEGAWNEDGKGLNVFDFAFHSANMTVNGDVACDFYHRYKEDIAIAKEIGFNVFRMSISWTRIFPKGRNTEINELGVQFYHKVIDTLLANNIQPIVTLFHFDTPLTVEKEEGGWLGDTVSDLFADYADFIFQTYGNKVKYWQTVNEPSFYCDYLGSGILGPAFAVTIEEMNKCLKNMLFSHAKAHKIYETKYKSSQKGMIGFGAGPIFARAKDPYSSDDVEAAMKMNELSGIGLTVDPFVFGDFSERVKASRGIAFTDEEKELVKGRVDFLAINIYGGRSVNASDVSADARLAANGPDSFGDHTSAWVLREMPKWVKARYDSVKHLPIFITENGLQTQGDAPLDDWDTRAVYCSAFLREMAAGINEDGTRVFGYTMWSLTDTFEFSRFALAAFPPFSRCQRPVPVQRTMVLWSDT